LRATSSAYQLTVVVSWSSFLELNRENVNRLNSGLAGVYEIWLGYTDGSKRRIYVGQASDLASRLSTHLQSSDNACVRGYVSRYQCFFRLALLSKQQERDGAERALYLRHNHHCNDPGGIPSGPNVTLSEQ